MSKDEMNKINQLPNFECNSSIINSAMSQPILSNDNKSFIPTLDNSYLLKELGIFQNDVPKSNKFLEDYIKMKQLITNVNGNSNFFHYFNNQNSFNCNNFPNINQNCGYAPNNIFFNYNFYNQHNFSNNNSNYTFNDFLSRGMPNINNNNNILNNIIPFQQNNPPLNQSFPQKGNQSNEPGFVTTENQQTLIEKLKILQEKLCNIIS
jgi:hypothetical protein